MSQTNLQQKLGKLRLKTHVIEKGSKAPDKELHVLYNDCKSQLSESEKQWYQHVIYNNTPVTPIEDNILFTRRSVRKWADEPITEDDLTFLIQAATWAPSSCNRQPIEIIIVKTPKLITQISKLRGQPFIEKANCILIILVNMQVYHKAGDYFSLLDAGAAIQNILLAAEQLKLGACWVNMSPKSRQYKELYELLSVPAEFKIASIIPLGRVAVKPPPPGRKQMPVYIDKYEK